MGKKNNGYKFVIVSILWYWRDTANNVFIKWIHIHAGSFICCIISSFFFYIYLIIHLVGLIHFSLYIVSTRFVHAYTKQYTLYVHMYSFILYVEQTVERSFCLHDIPWTSKFLWLIQNSNATRHTNTHTRTWIKLK